MTLPFAVAVFWLVVAIGLFGLARLLLARRLLDEDWQPLAAFGHALQQTLQSHGRDEAAVATLRELAPRMSAQTTAYARACTPGGADDPFTQVEVIAAGLAREADALEAEAGRAALEAVRGQVLAYESFLQSEMKVLARTWVQPGHWLAAGVRGLLLLPLGLAFGGNIVQRARRRDLELDPRLVSAANLILGALALAAVAAVAAVAMDWIAGVRRGLEG